MDHAELFGNTVASVGAGYGHLRLLARSTPSVDVNIQSTSEKKNKKKKRTPVAAAVLASSCALLLRGQPAALSLSPLSGATRWMDACRAEELSSHFVKGHVGAWEQQRTRGRAWQACGFEHRRSSGLKGHGGVRAHPTSTIHPDPPSSSSQHRKWKPGRGLDALMGPSLPPGSKHLIISVIVIAAAAAASEQGNEQQNEVIPHTHTHTHAQNADVTEKGGISSINKCFSNWL